MPFFSPNLDKLENNKDVNKLCSVVLDAFKKGDTNTCYKAVDALSRIADPRANEVLLALLPNCWKLPPKQYTSDQVTELVIHALVLSNDPNMITPLLNFVWEEGSTQYFGPLIRLIGLNKPSAEGALIEILSRHTNFGGRFFTNPPTDKKLIEDLIRLLGSIGGERAAKMLTQYKSFTAFPNIIKAAEEGLGFLQNKKK